MNNNLNQSKMKTIYIALLTAYLIILGMLISRSTETKITPYEPHEYTFMEPKDLADDSTLSPGKRLTLDRIYDQGK